MTSVPTSQSLCFNTQTDRVCLLVRPIPVSPQASDQINTQLSFGQIGDAISSAANTVGNFFRDNAVPLAIGAGGLAAAGLGAAGLALGGAFNQGGSGTQYQTATFGDIPAPTPGTFTIGQGQQPGTSSFTDVSLAPAQRPSVITFGSDTARPQYGTITNFNPQPQTFTIG